MQISMGLDGKRLEPESNVLLASIENMPYELNLDVLHMVTSYLCGNNKYCSMCNISFGSFLSFGSSSVIYL